MSLFFLGICLKFCALYIIININSTFSSYTIGTIYSRNMNMNKLYSVQSRLRAYYVYVRIFQKKKKKRSRPDFIPKLAASLKIIFVVDMAYS